MQFSIFKHSNDEGLRWSNFEGWLQKMKRDFPNENEFV